MKILVIFGTRPEAIKCFPVINEMRKHHGIEVITCATAQHRKILDQVLDLINLTPDFDLHLMREKPTLTEITVDVIEEIGKVMEETKPDRVLVQGDTTTTMAASLAAFYRNISVGHIEAGLRTNTILSPWPEEANRRIVSIIADMHFAPTQKNRDNLIRENVSRETIYVTGNTVIDALHAIRGLLNEVDLSEILPHEQLVKHSQSEKKLVLLTAHRRENWGAGITQICAAAHHLASRDDVWLAYPVHPNPHVAVPVREALSEHPNICLLDPLDYAAFVALLDRSSLVLTDSGGVQEEAPAFGKPVLILRDTTERPEGVDAGAARLVGLNAENIITHAEDLLDNPRAYRVMSEVRNPFGDGQAAQKIVEAIVRNNSRPRCISAKRPNIVQHRTEPARTTPATLI